MADEVKARIIDDCNVLSISHAHAHHVNEWVAGPFLKQGESVAAPPEVWAETEIHEDGLRSTIDHREAYWLTYDRTMNKCQIWIDQCDVARNIEGQLGTDKAPTTSSARNSCMLGKTRPAVYFARWRHRIRRKQ